MKLLIAVFSLFAAVSAFGAYPPYTAFRGANGITVTSNPPNGTIVIDGSAISGSSAVPGGSTYSVQWNTNGSLAGDGHFQYTPELGGGDPSARLRLSYNTATNIFSAIGVGSASAHEFFLMSGGLSRWGLGTSGDLNPFSDAAGYSIGTVGLNRRPMLVNVQAAFQVDDKYALSKAANVLSVGNHVSWTDLVLLTDGQDRLHIASGGNVGIGTAFPTAHLTVSNTTITGPIFAAYASNNPAPALLVNSNGFVGLGTNVPAVMLHVRPSMSGMGNTFRIDDTNGTPRIQMGVHAAPNFGAIWFGDVGTTAANYAFLGDTTQSVLSSPSTTTPVHFAQGGNVRWTVGTGGHLTAGIDNTYGIGAASASRPAYLHLGGGGAGTVGLTVGGSVLQVTNGMVFMGVGGTSVDYTSSGSSELVRFTGAGPHSIYTASYASQFRMDGSSIALNSASGGRVGIGTNVPASTLHVRPTTSGQSYFRVDDTNGTPRMQVGVAFSLSERGTIWLGDVVPTASNQALFGDGLNTYMNGSNALHFVSRGAGRWTVDSSGHFVAFADNTYDIGASGATRPRNVYVAGGLEAGSVVGLTQVIGSSMIAVGSGGGSIKMTNTSSGVLTIDTYTGGSFNRINLGQPTAASPSLGRTNGHLAVIGGNGAYDGSNTNGVWVMGGPIIQDFTVTAPAAPSRQGAVYWNDGTNVCVVLRNSAGGLATNKLSMTAWP